MMPDEQGYVLENLEQRLPGRLIGPLQFDNDEGAEPVARQDIDEAFGSHSVRKLVVHFDESESGLKDVERGAQLVTDNVLARHCGLRLAGRPRPSGSRMTRFD